jgi:flagellar protein FlaI
METGHRGILGTLHANNSKETITRLQNKPMEVPETNIALLDIIINISKQTNINGRVIRRVMELTELERMDNTILLSNVYERQNIDEDIRKTTVPVRTLEKLAKSIGVTKSEIMDEIQIRKQILDWLIENKIIDYFEVTKIIQKYYEDPEKILNEIRN